MKKIQTEATLFEMKLAFSKFVDKWFSKDMNATLVVRHPENSECFVVTTADELTEVIKLLQSQLGSDRG